MNTFKKTQLIREYLGKPLKQYGFSYVGCDYFTLWVFRRQVGDITQEIVIQQTSPVEQEIKLGLHTGVYGWENQEIRDLLEEYKEKKVWEYETQEEYIQILKLFSDIIINHGLARLEEMMKPKTEDYPSPELNKRLYEQYEILLQQYNDKYHILEGENIEKQLKTISGILKEHSNDTFEQCKELLLGMASIYATLIQTNKGGIAHFNGKSFEISGIGKRKKGTEYPLWTVFHGWNLYRDNKIIDAVEMRYQDLLE